MTPWPSSSARWTGPSTRPPGRRCPSTSRAAPSSSTGRAGSCTSGTGPPAVSFSPPGGYIEPQDRTLLAAAVREVTEEAGIPPDALCLTRQLLGSPIDIDVHGIDASPSKGEPAHRHYDVRYAFYLSGEEPPTIALQDEEVSGTQWLPQPEVTSPTLRAKLLAAGLDGLPEPVNTSALIHDFTDRPTSPRVTRSDPLLRCPVRINQPPQLSSRHRKSQRGGTSGA
ncbi:NUDIX domain-containing protein [Streptomyces gougerotii]|nr:NUDIX domain-containing protein [Streptomyces gougerotii]